MTSALGRFKAPTLIVIRLLAKCLSPVALASSLSSKANELREVERLVSSNRAILLKALKEFDG
jgi:hypothetical protein